MKRYANLDGDSGVVAYAIAPGSITVRFTDGGTYLYDSRAPGAAAVAEMQRLAKAGRGLASYINRQVRGNFSARLA